MEKRLTLLFWKSFVCLSLDIFHCALQFHNFASICSVYSEVQVILLISVYLSCHSQNCATLLVLYFRQSVFSSLYYFYNFQKSVGIYTCGTNLSLTISFVVLFYMVFFKNSVLFSRLSHAGTLGVCWDKGRHSHNEIHKENRIESFAKEHYARRTSALSCCRLDTRWDWKWACLQFLRESLSVNTYAAKNGWTWEHFFNVFIQRNFSVSPIYNARILQKLHREK